MLWCGSQDAYIIRQFHDGVRPCVRTGDGESSQSENRLMSPRDYGKAARCRRCCSTCFCAAAIHVLLVRFSDDKDILRVLVHREQDVVVGEEGPLACVRRAVWGMLYADDAGTVSKSALK